MTRKKPLAGQGSVSDGAAGEGQNEKNRHMQHTCKYRSYADTQDGLQLY